MSTVTATGVQPGLQNQQQKQCTGKRGHTEPWSLCRFVSVWYQKYLASSRGENVGSRGWIGDGFVFKQPWVLFLTPTQKGGNRKNENESPARTCWREMIFNKHTQKSD